jgi:hypothetical protein
MFADGNGDALKQLVPTKYFVLKKSGTKYFNFGEGLRRNLGNFTKDCALL